MHRVIGHAVDDVKLTFVGPEDWQEMEWSDGTVLIRTVDSTRVFIGKSNSTNRFMKVEQLMTNWKGCINWIGFLKRWKNTYLQPVTVCRSRLIEMPWLLLDRKCLGWSPWSTTMRQCVILV